ncbi:MAG: hypothetical protein P8Y47_08035 [Alphaproteobacteria bacterium]
MRLPQKKRVLHEFEILELSAVNKPAQEGALAYILKRDGAPGGASGMKTLAQHRAEKAAFVAEQERASLEYARKLKKQRQALAVHRAWKAAEAPLPPMANKLAPESSQDSRKRDLATNPPALPVSAVLSEPGEPSMLAKALADVDARLSDGDDLMLKVDALEEELAGSQ